MILERLCKKYGLKPFEYVYFFLMVIYMSFMTPETRVLTGGITTRPIAFSIPVVLTIILLIRNRALFKKKIYVFLCILIIWSLIHIIDKQQFSFKEGANYFYIFYAFMLANIHLSVYRNKIFILYEDLMVFFSKLSLLIWIPTVIVPNAAMAIAQLFPPTAHGYNFLYLINWMNPNDLQVTYGIIRNSGCTWEPGRFAIMLCLGILFNLYSKGISLKSNKNVLWLLLALLTTMSTTGYVLCLLLYVYFYIKRVNIKYTVRAILIFSPLIYFGFQLEFLGDKLSKRINVYEQVEHINESWQWTEKNNENEHGVAYSMDRFPSLYFELQNFSHDPIIGYGANVYESYFYKYYTKSIGFCGGLAQILGQYGIILGMLLFVILYRSSKSIANEFNSKKRLGFFIYSIISMISYPLIWQSIYTAYWFYGYLDDGNNKREE